MSFRLGRHGANQDSDNQIPPLHLVLLEEPEAHLHPQVQQVFIKHAFKVLRRTDADRPAQLLVSTHSSHLTHEMGFDAIRYFQRATTKRPQVKVVSLAATFGTSGETKRFVERYLKLHHSNALFADAVIMVEGNAERILLPFFIDNYFKKLSSSYIEIVEVGGAHAHRLRELVELLSVPTLVITDLDAKNPSDEGKQVAPSRYAGYETANTALRKWLSAPPQLDELFKYNPTAFGHSGVSAPPACEVFFSHQSPGLYPWQDGESEAIASTFEDALVLQNLDHFRSGTHTGFSAKVQKALEAPDLAISDFCYELFVLLKSANKSEFALNALVSMSEINVPNIYRRDSDGCRRNSVNSPRFVARSRQMRDNNG